MQIFHYVPLLVRSSSCSSTEMRKQWHDPKYYTWLEQQGKTVEELNASLDPTWWVKHQEMVAEIGTKLKAARG